MSFIILYVTHPNKRTAERISGELLKKKLIACSNTFAIESSYWWKGKLVHEKEVVTLLKTRKELRKKVEQEILKIHPYETPCIMALPVSANNSYDKWIHASTSNLKN